LLVSVRACLVTFVGDKKRGLLLIVTPKVLLVSTGKPRRPASAKPREQNPAQPRRASLFNAKACATPLALAPHRVAINCRDWPRGIRAVAGRTKSGRRDAGRGSSDWSGWNRRKL